jgi:adenylyltransferase/sulfurtransferase
VTATLSRQEILRYSRHLIMPEVTLEGQKKLKEARVLCIGAGGLGSPLSIYLAAAGVGTIGMVDFDDVDFTNLQRQILFSTDQVGQPKLDAAIERLRGINPHLEYIAHPARLTSENALSILEGYDVVADGTDNFPTRYLVNDACVMLGKPNVYASIFRFEGQLTLFGTQEGPCYRCLYPEPPPPGMVPSCAEGGVLGVLPGILGCLQAVEAIKLILGIGTTMAGRLLMFDALGTSFREVKVRKDPNCPVCGKNPTVTELIDYEEFCGIRGEESHLAIDLADVPAITVGELDERLKSSSEALNILDVREPHEYQICHMESSRLIPLGELPSRLHELDLTGEYVVHCKTGGRSARAVKMMREAGFRKVSNLSGGITAWAGQIDPEMPTY